MFHIAAGVCLGIIAAVYALGWLSEWEQRRAEKRALRQVRKMLAPPKPAKPPGNLMLQIAYGTTGVFVLIVIIAAISPH